MTDMSCRWCAHFSCDKIIDVGGNADGICHRYPKQEIVNSKYFCGEIVIGKDYETEGSLMDGFFERMHEFRIDANKEREMRIAAEKKLIELRKRIKK
jgi:hypothetical protein